MTDLLALLKLRLLRVQSAITDTFAIQGQTELALFIAVGALILFLVLTRIAGRGSKRSDGFDRTSAVLGRLEKLEFTMNEFKTNSMRAIEQFKGDVGYLRVEIDEIKKLLGGSSSGGISGGGYDGGSTPLDDGGTQEASASSESGGSIASALVVDAAAVSSATTEQPPATSTEAEPVASLSSRLTKTRQGFLGKLKKLLRLSPVVDENLFEELEAVLVEADVGIATATKLMAELRTEIITGTSIDEEAVRSLLKSKVLQRMTTDSSLAEILPVRRENGPLVVMVVGVNGVGKTTTVAKLAQRWKDQGKQVLVVAADTFRAAAVDQLTEWGARVNVPVVAGAPDAKPATVVFDGMTKAKEGSIDVVIIDTAGRLHTKSNLMSELEGIKNVIERHQPGAPHETILVVDGATGQNALSQAKEFNDAVKLTGLIVTKLDGTPRGGIVVAIHEELKIPVRYIGVGESSHDLRVFAPESFVEALFDTSDVAVLDEPSAHGAQRRRRRDSEGFAVV